MDLSGALVYEVGKSHFFCLHPTGAAFCRLPVGLSRASFPSVLPHIPGGIVAVPWGNGASRTSCVWGRLFSLDSEQTGLSCAFSCRNAMPVTALMECLLGKL